MAAEAGRQLKKVNLELGSVDPFIVFADANLDIAVPGVAWARLLNAGQGQAPRPSGCTWSGRSPRSSPPAPRLACGASW
ncbi:MAG: aldehyde dehydrogenase family protein [Gemmatimonadetes bacterium]|nr:aldehyde dehydrogenase family protein [Gemmatimonadota bacterium]